MPTAITEQIKILVELQKIDAQVFQFKKELAEQPALQKKLEETFEKKKAHLKVAEEEMKAFQVKQKTKEMDLQSKEDKITKLQSQLFSLKSNKEYAAMEMEIKGVKADKSILEDDILKMLDVVEEIKSKITQEKAALAEEEKRFKAEVDALKKKSGDLQAEIATFEEKRKAYTPNIDSKLLTQYERILKSREGIALVPVRNNACGGCHMGLPPQAVNEIQMSDKLIVCEECARMLYWAP